MAGSGETGMPYERAKAVGDIGEQIACDHLVEQGYEIVDRNWRCDRGELDIVARRAELLVFCEVKTRRSVRFGTPIEAVTPAKAARLRVLSARWMGEHGMHARDLRIDVIGVLLARHRPAELQHLEGVA